VANLVTQPKSGPRTSGPPEDRGHVHVPDVDEELLGSIPPAEQDLARRNLTATVRRFDPGPAPGIDEYAKPECIGLLVIEGFLTRDVTFAGESSRELLGSGDMLRPWDRERDFMAPFSEATFTVLEPTALATLDQRVLRVGARWPGFVDELMRRALHRSRWLAIRLAISGVMRVDERILLFLWHAAGRWGRVTSRGVLLPLDVTHESLGELVGAQRPSVTTALNELRRAGRLEIGDDGFVLRGEPPT
jgi:CRP/FNR family transcriptional regulator, cyclic AMP receptor protein